MFPSDEAPADLLLDDVAATIVMVAPDAPPSALAGVPALLREAAGLLREEGDPHGAGLAEAAAAALDDRFAAGAPATELVSCAEQEVTALQAWRTGPRIAPPPASPPPAAAATSPGTPAPPAPASALPGARTYDAETVVLIGEFLTEAGEGLATADDILLTAETSAENPERVNALFRVFHTIKGVSGFLGFTSVTTLAHTTETLLNLAREGRAPLAGPVLEAVFSASGEMRRHLDEVRLAVEADRPVDLLPSVEAVLLDLRGCIAAVEGEAAPEATPPAASPAPPATEPMPVAARVAATPSPAPVAAPVAAAAPSLAPVAAPVAAAAPSAATPPEAPRAGPARLRETLKIDLERVDSLMELIGELIIVESMVVFSPEIREIPSLRVRKHLTQLSKISRDLQDVAMRMRMVPVRGVFQKMNRLVRELAHKTGKRVSLLVSGENTEMDRSMVERLEDPLVHMLRNAVDHGVEAPAQRSAQGKPPEAVIRLSAYHEGGSVVIEVADDGRGLDREAILQRAIARGLVHEGESLPDSEVFALIFAPGFSTAAAVTELSGRGVGMDVVKRTVEDLRGRVMILSTAGVGSTFRLVLPLTLAIIDGMLVACGGERYIVPSLSIIESLQPRPGMISTYRNRDELIDVRGELLPLFRLGRIFGIATAVEEPTHALVMVVESMGRKVGLLVDDVVSQQQVVIKPVGTGIGNQESFSGAAILSDGKVGLILNIDRICNAVGVRAQRAGWGNPHAHA